LFDQLFNCPETVALHSCAPLLKQRLEFLQHCAASGSPRSTLRRKAHELLVIVDQFNLQLEGFISVDGIEAAARRWAYRQPSHYKLKEAEKTRIHFVRVTRRWIAFLNRLQPPPTPPYLHLVDEFAAHMERDKGLSPMTIRSECGHIKEFLDGYWTNDHVLSNISIRHIDDAIAAKGTRDGCTRGSIQFYAASLRSFFRYAEMKHWCPPGLAEAIMAPRVYQHEMIPAGPPWNVVERLLASTEGNRPVDIRDRAILMLFATYGLRSEEVQLLQLENLDWEKEVIHVLRPKPRRVQQFPLVPSVGESILRYLTEIRLQRPSRHVFLTIKAPYSPLSRSALWKAVSDRLRPLNVSIRHYGPHSLRHACATRLLAEGFSMKEIADYLGHRDLDSTGVYAKVDMAGLREVAEFELRGLL
jgi:site-specific recombinase XerD